MALRPLRFLTLTTLLWGLACVRTQLPAAAGKGSLKVDFISVGHGDSALVVSASGKTVLIDGGQAEDGPSVLAHLRKRRACPLDLILLSHRHSDHLGGLLKVVEECGARLFLDSAYPHPSRQYARLLEAMERRQIPVRNAKAGRRVDLGGGAMMTLLGPPDPFLSQGEDGVNANSVVARLAFGKVSVLFTGDAESMEEAWLLSQPGGLQSTVLKVGHHGSRHSSTLPFLRQVSPTWAVVSSRPQDPKHPHPQTLERLTKVRAKVLGTAQEGSIFLTTDGHTLTFRTEHQPQGVRVP